MIQLCRKLKQRIFIPAEFLLLSKQSFSQNTHTHQVFVSTSDDIYTNLALEEWFYEKADLNKKSILLMWQNKPAVVIGRHQNPWLECNVPKLRESGIKLARRISGGGCVYHDLGNLNCSFLKTYKLYNRRRNLDLVVEAITRQWDVDLQVNAREDIVLDGLYKVSGTASKLGKNNTFHHFTLLHDVNAENLEMTLDSPMKLGVHSKATDSKRSHVKNLSECDLSIDFMSLVEVIGHQYFKAAGTQGEIEWIDPGDEASFPGVTQIRQASEDWEWIFGRTPKFTLDRKFTSNKLKAELSVIFNFDKGRIISSEIICHCSVPDISEFTAWLQKGFTGQRLHREDLDKVLQVPNVSQFDFDQVTLMQWIVHCCSQTLCTGV
ncbi:lipoyltransferase 1, mitochondrial-like [Saccostrea cucullata]|uniref:lipoyltransferase 1, mitochondrial-like n=1 Tax=Saccostrea cuccullata TaxID=36930 RepID=UPI002ED5DCB8